MKKILIVLGIILLVVASLFFYQKYTIERSIVGARTKGSDAAIKISMQNIPSIAKIYFANHQNYGVSDLNNICIDLDGFTNILSSINKYSIKPIECDPGYYPAESFTVIAQSPANAIYCTDQNGFAGKMSAPSYFIAGKKCK